MNNKTKFDNLDKIVGGILLFVVGVFIVLYASQIFHGEANVAAEVCTSGKGSSICHLRNWIFTQYGAYGIGICYLLFGATTIGIAYYLVTSSFKTKPNKYLEIQTIDPVHKSLQTPQTLDDVLSGEQPTDAFLEELAALDSSPALSDEELERQALEQKL
ncbi:MAG: hypothetical protein CTY10_00580 [Methylotenera sp.]|nr:MAG: hypothetical protein CTY10_00580 [Methylotenera sp.]